MLQSPRARGLRPFKFVFNDYGAPVAIPSCAGIETAFSASSLALQVVAIPSCAGIETIPLSTKMFLKLCCNPLVRGD